MFEGKKKRGFIQNNRDPYKEEIKIPPPHPHKRKKINYFSHSKDPYFFPRQHCWTLHYWVTFQPFLNVESTSPKNSYIKTAIIINIFKILIIII
jgi:hypothetical protein